MCQLLGMNCAQKTDFCFSFAGFRLRGGLYDKHSDGWGLSIYEGRGLRTFTDTLPAAESPLAEMVSKYPIKTLNMISHIRYATQGHKGDLANVHPFQRELWGIQFAFCHNGDVPKFGSNKDWLSHPMLGSATERMFHPVGDTDSESLFCAILNALRAEYNEPPTLPDLYKTLDNLCKEIVKGEEDTSILNFLMCCGEYTQFAYSYPGARPGSKVWNGLFYTIRQPPFTKATLVDCEYHVDFSTVTTENDRVAVITTSPLTANEKWIEMKKGELLMFDRGLPYFHASQCEKVELMGRGLCSKVNAYKKRERFQSIDSILIPDEVETLDDTRAGENRPATRVQNFHKDILRSH